VSETIWLAALRTFCFLPPVSSDLLEWFQRHSWLDGCDLAVERQQARDEGRELASVESDFQRLLDTERDEAWFAAAGALMDRVQMLPCRADNADREPSDLPGIKSERPTAPALKAWRGSRREWQRRLHGGLLGRICGCMLGKPVEGWPRASIRITGEETGNWPPTNYWRQPTAREAKRIAGRQPRRTLNDRQTNWLRDGLSGMVEDDDINYTTSGFAILKRYGADFRPMDVASFWGDNLPVFHTCSAERAAYRNFASGILPPASATHRNPYREWIGAQIRADYFGYSNPGNPERAAEWAWRDASISHIKNGIYGEMWAAAMLAAAYVANDWETIIRAGLAQIPAHCRLREDIEKILRAHDAGASYDDTIQLVRAQWDEMNVHHWCHTNSNAQIVAVGLLWGEDDYEKTITRAVMPGFDTDCNGATCGSLWGVRHGVDQLPRKWTRPMHDLVRTGVAGYHEVKISNLAEEMVHVALQAAPARHR